MLRLSFCFPFTYFLFTKEIYKPHYQTQQNGYYYTTDNREIQFCVFAGKFDIAWQSGKAEPVYNDNRDPQSRNNYADKD